MIINDLCSSFFSMNQSGNSISAKSKKNISFFTWKQIKYVCVREISKCSKIEYHLIGDDLSEFIYLIRPIIHNFSLKWGKKCCKKLGVIVKVSKDMRLNLQNLDSFCKNVIDPPTSSDSNIIILLEILMCMCQKSVKFQTVIKADDCETENASEKKNSSKDRKKTTIRLQKKDAIR